MERHDASAQFPRSHGSVRRAEDMEHRAAPTLPVRLVGPYGRNRGQVGARIEHEDHGAQVIHVGGVPRALGLAISTLERHDDVKVRSAGFHCLKLALNQDGIQWRLSHNTGNLDLDPALIDWALELSGERTKKAAVTKALQEFVARREQARLLGLFGKLEGDKSFDHKQERLRD